MRKKPRIKWIPRLQLWDCTDGVIHGGGKTPEAAYNDFQCAIYCDIVDW